MELQKNIHSSIRKISAVEKYLWIYTDLNGHQNNFFFCLPQEKKLKPGNIIVTQTSAQPVAWHLQLFWSLQNTGYRQCHTSTLQELRCFSCSVKRHLGLVAGRRGRQREGLEGLKVA